MASQGTQLVTSLGMSSSDERIINAEQSAGDDIKPSAYRTLQRGRQIRRDEMDERMMLVELDPQW